MNTHSLLAVHSLITNNPISVAIAESNIKHLKVLEKFLNKQESIALEYTCTDGYRLLQYCQQNKLPEVLIISYELDVIDGIQTTSILKRLYPDVRIIIISGYLTMSAITTSIKVGALGFKPRIIVEELEQSMNTVPHESDFLSAINKVYNGDYYFSKLLLENQLITPELLRSRTLAAINSRELENTMEQLKLTEKEVIIILMYCTNLTKLQIAELLNISVKTLDNHLTHISRKINSNCTKDMVLQLYRLGIIQTASYNKVSHLIMGGGVENKT